MKNNLIKLSIFIFSLTLISCSGGSSNNRSDNKQITNYSIQVGNKVYDGLIKDNNIEVIMPSTTQVTNLVAIFTTTGQTVMVGSTTQVSGVTPNNFTGPLIYTVVAQDNTTKDYTVTINRPAFFCVADGNDACGCLIQNDGSDNPFMWYRYVSIYAYIYSYTNQQFILQFNLENHCGYKDWHIPSVTGMGGYLGESNALGGDWAELGYYAAKNGYNVRSNFGDWLIKNNFTGVIMWEGAQFYASSTLGAEHDEWNSINIFNGEISIIPFGQPAWIIPVRGGN